MNRVSASVRNSVAAIIGGFLVVAVGFVTRAVFVDTLGVNVLGLYGLFQNIITMLAVAELGVGAAIIYHLYEPLHKKNELRVIQLMLFYRRLYRFVSLAVVVFGLAIMPFLQVIAPGVDSDVNLYVIFAIFIGDAAISYLMAFRRSILYADQNSHLISTVHMGTVMAMNLTQIGLLVATHNFYLFLAIKVIATIVENLILNRIIIHKYPYLLNKVKPLDAGTKTDIYTKTKGLLYHKLGEFFVLGTDNIIISMFLGVAYVGLYNNYLLVIEALKAVFVQASTAVRASVGNLLLSNDKVDHYRVFRNVHFLNMWLATIAAVSFFVVVNNFIIVWLGKDYVFSTDIVAVLAVNLFLAMMRTPIETFKTAAGIFYEDKMMPVIESIINLVVSIVLVQFMGIVGVFIGTLCSLLFLHVYSFPKYTYTRLFNKPAASYLLLMLRAALLVIGIGAVAYFAADMIKTGSDWLDLMLSGGVAVLISNTILLGLYSRTPEFGYYVGLLKRMIKKATRTI